MSHDVRALWALSGPIAEAMTMLPEAMNSVPARVMLLAIGLQESGLTERRQLVGSPPRPVGPAKGLWQFEQGGGCVGVLRHKASAHWARHVCGIRGVEPRAKPLWDALERDDALAAAAARLLLFTDPRPLPAVGEAEEAWELYLRTWRPGKPLPAKWPRLYEVAKKAAAAA